MSGLDSNNPLVRNPSKDAHKPRSGWKSVSAQVVVRQAHHDVYAITPIRFTLERPLVRTFWWIWTVR